MQKWLELCHPGRLLTSPGVYAMPAGLIALGAVGSPRAAPEWFFLVCLSFAGLGVVLAFWGVADLSITLRRYRAETISFEVAAQGMARAARTMFRAAQMGAIALAIGVGAGLALAFPGLAILAAMLSPVFAIAIAALPGAVVVPRLADAALALVVPVTALSPGGDVEERFRVGWRFGARMGAVRAALADRSAPLPSEARDFVKALDGGGMIRPPIARLSLASGGALGLRTRGLKGVVVPALPVALFVWLVATLMPPGALSALPRPGDALSRARATNNDPMPVLKRLDPAQSPGRMVAELRKMLSLRFVHAIPAAEAALLHRQATQALGRLARQLRWRRVRIALVNVILTYGWTILGLVFAGGLIAVAILYRDAIGSFFTDLLGPAPAAPPAAATTSPAQPAPPRILP